jgi:hypothetical protein
VSTYTDVDVDVDDHPNWLRLAVKEGENMKEEDEEERGFGE